MKNKDYSKLATAIVENVGGKRNVKSVFHCVSRVRFKLKDYTITNRDNLEKLEGVISVIESGDQYQVVIGNEVDHVFQAILAKYDLPSEETMDLSVGEEEKKGNIVSRFLLVFPPIFTPILPVLGGAGMLKALLLIFTTFSIMTADSSTYKILSAAANSTFYFLPLLLAVTSAKAFKVNMFTSLVIVAALMEPNFTSLMKANGDMSSFLGIPVVMMNYASTVVPAILSIWLYSYLEKGLKKVIPTSIEMFTIPMISLLVMVPICAMLIGPIGVTIATTLGDGMAFLSDKSPI